MRVRELFEALKMRALPEGGYDKLLEFLRMFRDASQYIVDCIWGLDSIPSIKNLHRMFYRDLRGYGFRAHHVKQIYCYAKAVVESAKKNGGKKPILRRLAARIDKYDYRLELENRVLVLKLHNGYEARLKLLTSNERIEKFLSWSSYELVLKFDGECFWVSIYFRRAVSLKKPKAFMSIDKNFDNITLTLFSKSGEVLKIKRFRTPLRKILTHKIWVERIMRRYPRSWSFIKGVKKSIRRHGERMRNIAKDYSHKIANIVADIANKYTALTIQENLRDIRENIKRGNSFNKKLSLWLYKKLSFAIEYKLLERSLETKYVDPRNTSSKCPKCSSKLRENSHRILRCMNCGFIGDRDVIACINLFLKYSRCAGSGVPVNTPKPDETPSGMQGKRDEGMTPTYINLYKT